MTIQQEAINLIYYLPDEDVQLITQIMKKMSITSQQNLTAETTNVSKRIGLGKGIINDPKSFDEWDAEITDLFEGY